MKFVYLLTVVFGLFHRLSSNLLLPSWLSNQKSVSINRASFTDAADFGFLPTETGVKNAKALQAAVNTGGTILISKMGTYKLAGTVYIGDNTSLVFGNGVVVEKSNETGRFTHVFLNKGALERVYNHNITITGLDIRVNNVDLPMSTIYGLRGHVAFFYVKDLKIERFRCSGLVNGQFALHICTFEDLLINDVIITGKKDGIHLGPGKRFRISNGVFQTGDDAIALVPGDWVSANPEFGNLEDGIIENCSDIPDDYLEGAFSKIVASAWVDWKPGIKVKHGDAVVSNGRIYRVVAALDNRVYKSGTQPNFEKGMMVLDSINWLMFQKDTIHTAVVKNVVFRDIFLYSQRVPFQLMSYSNKWSHSYYPGAPLPIQGPLSFENVTMFSENKKALVSITTPINVLNVRNASLKNNWIDFGHAADYAVYPKTYVSFANCQFHSSGLYTLITNRSKGKQIVVKTTGSIETGDNFSANVVPGQGNIQVESDLTGLKKQAK
ncbi:glycoside hydrolase family protein [Spirosoma aerolatum]|uniref:hypothetical protein n=1 Tax=Spirosoma aerolatum TaxID=1211326 RepID=UPI0009AEAE23|nr:hypothetical protein [Spirosoma aerolatum]